METLLIELFSKTKDLAISAEPKKFYKKTKKKKKSSLTV